MSDNTALADKLAVLAAKDTTFAAGARVISDGGSPPPLVAILREIDDTILERTLTFALGEVEVDMVIAGRRLKGLTGISVDVKGKDAVIGNILSREDEGTLDASGVIMNELANDDQRVTVRFGPATRIGHQAEAGVSIRALGEYWHVDVNAKPSPPIVRFLAKNSYAMLSSIHVVDGAIVNATGETAVIEEIWQSQAANFAQDHAEIIPDQDQPILICLDNAVGGNRSAAIARAAGEICVFSYDPTQIGPVLASWSAITSR